MPEKHLQNPALFLQEEAEMAGEEIVYEVEDNDVPGYYSKIFIRFEPCIS